MNVKGKSRRSRGGHVFHRPNWRKAVVTLTPDDKIELFEGM